MRWTDSDLAHGRLDLDLDCSVGLSGSKRESQHDTRAGRTPEEVRRQFERCAVGPVEVVEQQHQRLLHSQALDQIAHRPMGAVALRRGARLIRSWVERPERGEHSREFGKVLYAQAVESARVERFEVLVEGVDHHAERQLALELGCASVQGEAAPLLGPLKQLGEKRCLADPGFARDENDLRSSPTPVLEQSLEQLPLRDHGQ